MAALRTSPGTHKHDVRHGLIGIFGLLSLALLTASYAQQAAPSGEELYVDRLGCWNCHGQSGGGGAGPSIVKSQLPLRKWVAYVRLPSETMPRFGAALASDAELAILYRWLDGIDAVKAPPPITLNLKASGGVTADGQKKAETEVELTARPAGTSLGADVPNVAALRYRVLLKQAAAPVANQTVEFQVAGREGRATFTTDEHGEAVLGPDKGFVVTDARETGKPATTRLRVALATGRYALLVEAIDDTDAAKPVVVGIGTAILNVD